MKRTLIATAMAIGLVAACALAPLSPVFAQATGAETDTIKADWLGRINTRIDLAQARAALLRARLDLEAEEASEWASGALADAQARIMKARETATKKVDRQLQSLAADVQEVRATLAATPAVARERLDGLISETEAHLQEMRQATLETEEAQRLQRRYAQIEAQAALLRAQLAELSDETGETVAAHLDDALAWYRSTREGASEEWQSGLTEITGAIEAAQRKIAEDREQAAAAISALAERAADIVKGSEAGDTNNDN